MSWPNWFLVMGCPPVLISAPIFGPSRSLHVNNHHVNNHPIDHFRLSIDPCIHSSLCWFPHKDLRSRFPVIWPFFFFFSSSFTDISVLSTCTRHFCLENDATVRRIWMESLKWAIYDGDEWLKKKPSCLPALPWKCCNLCWNRICRMRCRVTFYLPQEMEMEMEEQLRQNGSHFSQIITVFSNQYNRYKFPL